MCSQTKRKHFYKHCYIFLSSLFLKFMNKKLNTHLNVPEKLVGIKIAAQPSTEEELRIFYNSQEFQNMVENQDLNS